MHCAGMGKTSLPRLRALDHKYRSFALRHNQISCFGLYGARSENQLAELQSPRIFSVKEMNMDELASRQEDADD